jgi:hypothetical protein
MLSPDALRLTYSAIFSMPRRGSVCDDKGSHPQRDHGTHGRCDEMQGLTFEQIAQAMNKDEVWVAALFYGQVSSILLAVCVECTLR